MSDVFKILVVDLDGTLLDSRGRVSDRNRKALQDASATGLHVMVATGRTVAEARATLQLIEHAGLIIAAGGSLLCEVESGETLHRHAIEHDVVVDAFETLERHGHATLILKDRSQCGYDYLVAGTSPIDAASEWWFRTLPLEVRYARDVDQDEDREHTIRIGAVASSGDIAPVAREMEERLGDRASCQHWPAVTSTEATGSATHLLEVFGRDVNKWTMLERYCRQEGICTSRVIAIGDGLNDVELVENAGLGIAMGNAMEVVREAARRHTGHHDEDGFADAVEAVLSGEWV